MYKSKSKTQDLKERITNYAKMMRNTKGMSNQARINWITLQEKHKMNSLDKQQKLASRVASLKNTSKSKTIHMNPILNKTETKNKNKNKTKTKTKKNTNNLNILNSLEGNLSNAYLKPRKNDIVNATIVERAPSHSPIPRRNSMLKRMKKMFSLRRRP